MIGESDKFIKWIIFSVLISLVPLGVCWIFKLMFDQDTSLGSLLSKGELLLITVGLCATGIGELIGSGNSFRKAKIISGGLSVVILMISALLFSLFAVPDLLNVMPDPNVIKSSSITIYISSLFSSGSCIYLSE